MACRRSRRDAGRVTWARCSQRPALALALTLTLATLAHSQFDFSSLSSAVAQDTTPQHVLQDSVHFFYAAEALTGWAEEYMALSVVAYKALLATPGGGATRTACMHNGTACLFNPLMLGSAGFPAPHTTAEKVLKRYALESLTCRGSADSGTCVQDANCAWDGTAASCALAHDAHTDFTAAIRVCPDSIYTSAAGDCWRRRPDPANPATTCGAPPCKFYPRGTTPEDRCMPDSASRPAPEVYALLKHRFGDTLAPTADMSLVGAAAGAAAVAGVAGAAAAGGVQPPKEGFGSCPEAALHHAFATMCRTAAMVECTADSRCTWLSGGSILGGVKGEHCTLSQRTTVELLLGGSPFGSTVTKAEADCAAAASQEACLAVALVIRTEGR